MGKFSKFQSAKMSGGGFRYPQAGDHTVRVTSVKMGTSRKGIEFFAVEAEIIHTTSTHGDMSPGNRVDWSTHADKDPYEGNVLQFVGAVYGFSEQQLKGLDPSEFDQAMELLTGEQQSANGKVLKMCCVDRVSKAGNTYVAVRWEAAGTASPVG